MPDGQYISAEFIHFFKNPSQQLHHLLITFPQWQFFPVLQADGIAFIYSVHIFYSGYRICGCAQKYRQATALQNYSGYAALTRTFAHPILLHSCLRFPGNIPPPVPAVFVSYPT